MAYESEEISILHAALALAALAERNTDDAFEWDEAIQDVRRAASGCLMSNGPYSELCSAIARYYRASIALHQSPMNIQTHERYGMAKRNLEKLMPELIDET